MKVIVITDKETSEPLLVTKVRESETPDTAFERMILYTGNGENEIEFDVFDLVE